MKPAALRDATWQSLQTGLSANLISVHHIWLTFGPGTTRRIAQESGWDILSFRPRTTDLFNLGLVELVGCDGHQGIYRARAQADWEKWFTNLRSTPSGQLHLI